MNEECLQCGRQATRIEYTLTRLYRTDLETYEKMGAWGNECDEAGTINDDSESYMICDEYPDCEEPQL